MSGSNAVERAAELRLQITTLENKQHKWGTQNSNFMLALKFAGTAFAGAAAIAAVFTDVDRAWTAALVAVSGALFLLLQQLRFSDRANAHYFYSDDLKCLLAELDWQTSIPITDAELRSLSEKFQAIIIRHQKVFAAINNFLGQQANHQDRLANEENKSH